MLALASTRRFEMQIVQKNRFSELQWKTRRTNQWQMSFVRVYEMFWHSLKLSTLEVMSIDLVKGLKCTFTGMKIRPFDSGSLHRGFWYSICWVSIKKRLALQYLVNLRNTYFPFYYWISLKYECWKKQNSCNIPCIPAVPAFPTRWRLVAQWPLRDNI